MNRETNKALLRAKLVDFQKEVLNLAQKLDAQDQQHRAQEDHLFLELAAVLDAFENVFKSIEHKEDSFDKSARRALKSFRAIHRKLLRILADSGVVRLEFPGGKAQIGLCKVVDTERVDGSENGHIVSVVRNGYRRGDRILRPAEVITVAHSQAKEHP